MPYKLVYHLIRVCMVIMARRAPDDGGGRLSNSGFALRMAALYAGYLIFLTVAFPMILSGSADGSRRSGFSELIISVAILVVSWYVLVLVQTGYVSRRENDMGGVPFWSLPLLFPPTNLVYTLLLCVASPQTGPNPYGPDPRRSRTETDFAAAAKKDRVEPGPDWHRPAMESGDDHRIRTESENSGQDARGWSGSTDV